jgi:hypothetical protein
MFNAIKQTIGAALVAALVVAIPFTPSRAQGVNRDAKAAHLTNSSTARAAEPEKNPAKILGDARTLYVWSRTVFVKQEVIESELLQRADFRQSGLTITKDGSAADLVLTVRRSNFTTEYPYDVVDQKTGLVVASGKVNSLFGTAAGKIAKGFTKQLQRARSEALAKS